MKQKVFTDLEGVYATGIHAGIKQKKKDLTLIYVPEATGSAGVFTRNLCAATCVTHTRKAMKSSIVKAVIINSGNANAYTGEKGRKDTKNMAKIVANELKLKVNEVAVASTGIIGVNLPIEKVEQGLKKICQTPCEKNAIDAAEGILTVDLTTKLVYKSAKIGGKEVVIAGISKGSGMIAPNMATTLTFLVTNADMSSTRLQRYLQSAINDSLNMVSLDTDTSTNDMVLIFSTGEHKKVLQTQEDEQHFQELMTTTCIDVTKQIARDGEGATKLIEVQVKGAASKRDARLIAKNVVASPLVKTSITAGKANWGRLVMAVGKDERPKVNEEKLDIQIGNVALVKKGCPLHTEKEAEKEMVGETVIISINLNLSTYEATAWGCDLTNDFIKINTEYN